MDITYEVKRLLVSLDDDDTGQFALDAEWAVQSIRDFNPLAVQVIAVRRVPSDA